jgi:hypothetical protein
MDSNTKTEIARQYLAGRYNDDIMNDYRISKPELYKILAELKIPRKQIKISSTAAIIAKLIIYCSV